MINAKIVSNNPLRVHLSSTNHNKTLEVTRYHNCFMVVYSSNGQRFDKPCYQEVLDHLTKKGW